MTDSTEAVQRDVAAARNQGRRQGLAIAALALGLVSFLNLLGAEKSILAIVLAISAMSGSVSRQVRRRSLAAIGLAILHLVTIGVVLVLFQEELGQLVELLQKLA
jgi:uncharacterized BrkB/YihY/UPF0761 family membrane protein